MARRQVRADRITLTESFNSISVNNNILHGFSTALSVYMSHGFSTVCSSYDGDVLNGLRHGIGTFVDKDGKLIYTGEWEQGKRHGKV